LLLAIGNIEETWRTSLPETARAPSLELRWRPYRALLALKAKRGNARGAFEVLATIQNRMFLAQVGASPLDPEVGPEAAIGRYERSRQFQAELGKSPLARPAEAGASLAALGQRFLLVYFSAGDVVRLLVVQDGQVMLASTEVAVGRMNQLIDDFFQN